MGKGARGVQLLVLLHAVLVIATAGSDRHATIEVHSKSLARKVQNKRKHLQLRAVPATHHVARIGSHGRFTRWRSDSNTQTRELLRVHALDNGLYSILPSIASLHITSQPRVHLGTEPDLSKGNADIVVNDQELIHQILGPRILQFEVLILCVKDHRLPAVVHKRRRQCHCQLDVGERNALHPRLFHRTIRYSVDQVQSQFRLLTERDRILKERTLGSLTHFPGCWNSTRIHLGNILRSKQLAHSKSHIVAGPVKLGSDIAQAHDQTSHGRPNGRRHTHHNK